MLWVAFGYDHLYNHIARASARAPPLLMAGTSGRWRHVRRPGFVKTYDLKGDWRICPTHRAPGSCKLPFIAYRSRRLRTTVSLCLRGEKEEPCHRKVFSFLDQNLYVSLCLCASVVQKVEPQSHKGTEKHQVINTLFQTRSRFSKSFCLPLRLI